MASRAKLDPDVPVAKLVALAVDLRAIADSLISHGNMRRDVPGERARVARRALDDRAARRAHLPSRLFGEPGWDILLDLFVAEDRGRPISVSSATIASGAPPTTASRWIDDLVQMGLVARRAHPIDRRSTYLDLTAAGRQALSAWADDELAREFAAKR